MKKYLVLLIVMFNCKASDICNLNGSYYTEREITVVASLPYGTEVKIGFFLSDTLIGKKQFFGKKSKDTEFRVHSVKQRGKGCVYFTTGNDAFWFIQGSILELKICRYNKSTNALEKPRIYYTLTNVDDILQNTIVNNQR